MSNIIAIPLNKLTRSARNVRKSGGDSIDELATSILVHGLIHNLTVVKQQADNGENSGKYEVVAGGRRFAALQRLAKQKKVRLLLNYHLESLPQDEWRCSTLSMSMRHSTYFPAAQILLRWDSARHIMCS